MRAQTVEKHRRSLSRHDHAGKEGLVDTFSVVDKQKGRARLPIIDAGSYHRFRRHRALRACASTWGASNYTQVMQIPFLDATKGNPELSAKPQAGIRIADHLTVRNADENVLCAGSSSHTL